MNEHRVIWDIGLMNVLGLQLQQCPIPAAIFTSDHKSALTPVHAQLHICRPADLVHLPTRQNCAPHMPKVQHQLMAKQLHNICDQSASRMDKIETALIMPKFQQKQTMYKLA